MRIGRFFAEESYLSVMLLRDKLVHFFQIVPFIQLGFK